MMQFKLKNNSDKVGIIDAHLGDLLVLNPGCSVTVEADPEHPVFVRQMEPEEPIQGTGYRVVNQV